MVIPPLMEPDSSWRLAFLALGVLVPAAAMVADIVWWGSNALVIMICIAWFGFFFFVVEGVTE
ncbi:hypothetical protein L0Y59_04425 [Candidatus Uhrbacteria bacterium]|nr:hypothetical protein [Candidatus Uhrbacteria bacterium]